MGFHLDDLTLRQIKEIKNLLRSNDDNNTKHGATGQYCIVRTYASGVHFGLVEDVQPNEGRSRCVLAFARRLWYWKTKKGVSLSDLAASGLDVEKSKVCCEVEKHFIEDVIEFIPIVNRDVIEEIKGVKVYGK